MTVYLAKGCGCRIEVGMGARRPERCMAHENRFYTEAQLRKGSTGIKLGSLAPPSNQVRSIVAEMSVGLEESVEQDHPKPKLRRKPLKRTRRRETKAERLARGHFNDTVKARVCWFRWHRPCERCGGSGETEAMTGIWWACTACGGDGKHHCEGPKDAHHLIPKQFIRKRFQGILPEPRFVAILFNPKIGAPLCRKAHDRIEAGSDRIYWEDLTDECIEYVGSLPDFVLLRLEEEAPKRQPVEHRQEVERSAAA